MTSTGSPDESGLIGPGPIEVGEDVEESSATENAPAGREAGLGDTTELSTQADLKDEEPPEGQTGPEGLPEEADVDDGGGQGWSEPGEETREEREEYGDVGVNDDGDVTR